MGLSASQRKRGRPDVGSMDFSTQTPETQPGMRRSGVFRESGREWRVPRRTSSARRSWGSGRKLRSSMREDCLAERGIERLVDSWAS